MTGVPARDRYAAGKLPVFLVQISNRLVLASVSDGCDGRQKSCASDQSPSDPDRVSTGGDLGRRVLANGCARGPKVDGDLIDQRVS
jgi:hypothetical protein